MPTFLVSLRAKLKWLYTKAFAALAGLAALSVIPALFSLFTTLLQQHLEHSFLKTSQSVTLLQQRIDKRNQLLADFVATSNELLAVRYEASMSRVAGDIRSQTGVICEQLRSLGKVSATTKVKECHDKDWDKDTRKQTDTTWGLIEKANEKNAKLQSLSTEIEVIFAPMVSEKLRAVLALTDPTPLLGSPSLDDLESNFSVEHPPATPMTEPMVNDLLSKVQLEIHNDPLRQATGAVIGDMARELEEEISTLPK